MKTVADIPEWKKRYDFTEQVVEEARVMMSRPEVIDALGDKATLLSTILEFVTPRPVVDEQITCYEGDNDNTVYTVSLAVNEKANMPSTKTNRYQFEAAAQVFGLDVAQKFRVSDEVPICMTMVHPLYGFCRAAIGSSETENQSLNLGRLYVRGRPAIGLLYDSTERVDWRALTLLHEVDHAARTMAYPIQFAKDDEEIYLRSELSAYATQSAIARAVGITDAAYAPHQIEDIRREFNGDLSSNEAYATSAGITQRLTEKGLSHIYQ